MDGNQILILALFAGAVVYLACSVIGGTINMIQHWRRGALREFWGVSGLKPSSSDPFGSYYDDGRFFPWGLLVLLVFVVLSVIGGLIGAGII